jgi:protein tyrosine/serine phosphatase
LVADLALRNCIKRRIVTAGLFSLNLAGFLVLKAQAQRGLPAQESILNFGKISETLYRGAQPDALGLTNLAKLGVKLIINLRMTNDLWAPEEVLATAQGILYTNFPLRGLGRPTDEQIRMILATIAAAPGPVFVHCQHGCDRTGTVIACYRIQHDNWTSDAALTEAVRYGISRFERGMKRFIADFSKQSSPKNVASASGP